MSKLFNASTFLDLQSRIGVSRMGALFDIFQRTSVDGFNALDEAAEADQEACLHQVTHSLVSTAGTFGFDQLSAESRVFMEGACASLPFRTRVDALRALFDRSLAALDETDTAVSARTAA